MSSSSSSFFLFQSTTFPSTPCPSNSLLFHNNPTYIPFKTTFKHSFISKTLHLSKPLTVSFALTESDSPKSLEPDLQTLLQQVAESFDLPSDYFSQLPGDLRLDCGVELGEVLLNLSRAWELADTSTSYTLASKLPSLVNSLTDSAKSACGRRLVATGRRFQSMGRYGQGELQKIAKAMDAAGRLLSASSISSTTEEQPKTETRMFKVGELQVEVTSEKANIGVAISFVVSILSWQTAQGIQSVPESSLEYANDNALLLAKGSTTCTFLFIHDLVRLYHDWTFLTWKTAKV